MHSKNVPQGCIVVGRDEIELMKECLLRTDREYLVRHKWSFMENKIGVEGIYHDKRYAQNKARQDPMCQSLQ